MHLKSDPYTFSEYTQITGPTSSPIGSLHREYEATLYDDVMCDLVSQGTAVSQRRYLIKVTQRVRITNANGISFVESNTGSPVYNDYPILLQTSLAVGPVDQTTVLDLELVSYSPKTVSTKIETSGSQADSTGASSSNGTSSTIGSSTAQTNSYGASVTVGMDGPSASANYEHSTTETSDQSNTASSERGASRNHELSNAASMSIKDWGAYAYVNQSTSVALPGSVTWTFGQEYPWDVLQSRNFQTNGAANPLNQSQFPLVLSTAQQARLWDGQSLYPPSHLASYGFEFICKSMWLWTIPNGVSDTLSVETDMDLYTASHATTAAGGTQPLVAVVYRDSSPATLAPVTGSLTRQIDVALLALNPISAGKRNAVVGFVTNQYIVPPAQNVALSILSVENDLLVRDVTAGRSQNGGTTLFSASDTGLIATIGAPNDNLFLMAYFKVTENEDDYTLYLKGWLGLSSPVVTLFITINGSETATVEKAIFSEMGEGGEGNLIRISLRDLNFASVDYHDYIRLGLNQILIRISSSQAAAFQLLAMSIERS